MKPLAVAFLVAITTSALAGTPLKVMTFNVRYDGGLRQTRNHEAPWAAAEGPSRRDMVLQLIADEMPDLLAVQEALANQVEDIHDLLKQYGVYAVGRDDGKQGGEHCAIFYRADRFEVRDSGTFWLCDAADRPGSKHPDAACPRIASWVVVADKQNSDQPLMFVDTHWDHQSQPAREYAARAIVKRLLPMAPQQRIVVAGDMNAVDDTPEMRALRDNAQLSLADAYCTAHPTPPRAEGTFNEFRNLTDGRRIDHVLVSPPFQVRSARIVTTTFDGLNASDHFPLVVEIE